MRAAAAHSLGGLSVTPHLDSVGHLALATHEFFLRQAVRGASSWLRCAVTRLQAGTGPHTGAAAQRALRPPAAAAPTAHAPTQGALTRSTGCSSRQRR